VRRFLLIGLVLTAAGCGGSSSSNAVFRLAAFEPSLRGKPGGGPDNGNCSSSSD
jgi:hypothetical protein